MHLSARSTRRAGYAALPLAVLLSGVVVATTSYAAFSDRTENAGNNWSAGKVAISDNDADQALFKASGLMPGDADDNCITVTADTSGPSTVKLYTENTQDADQLGASLHMKIERGALTGADCSTFQADGAADFDGTLAALASNSSYATGLGGWVADGAAQSTTYRISYELDPNADNKVQEASASTTFVWEAQSN
ncbi:hypothetical protein [Frigoribacterium sp. Leaf186]|uniref:hypothetical protein n=1 Tax=Frigoribacterium sp. Leaf186 TaxID=1736293 RepID=UPI0006F9FD23|nr:hypothetical protein [Frigoribacterium sp. Leaf186]KQS22553.1 hypothetical protein ASG05_03050 [Frigoribacterium sp. Leaf186]